VEYQSIVQCVKLQNPPLSPKANGSNNIHEKNLKSSKIKEVILEKVALKENEKSEGILKKHTKWV
jgi:hypothetical protein